MAEQADLPKIEPLLCSIKAGSVILGRSTRAIIDMIARGEIKAVKSDRRTLLVVESLKSYAASLPAAKGCINRRGRKGEAA
jgi:hypothetical protein